MHQFQTSLSIEYNLLVMLLVWESLWEFRMVFVYLWVLVLVIQELLEFEMASLCLLGLELVFQYLLM